MKKLFVILIFFYLTLFVSCQEKIPKENKDLPMFKEESIQIVNKNI